ncbi:unnamed protein product [Paramecium sonneborni]|uniref:Uncharacterized protein n=1 Tax=Paramecium sonneborni TaxID=65129 RepID=A0A8S1Q1N7_9CILI|nr:unnamed protein product [Paramecium sonneborni]
MNLKLKDFVEKLLQNSQNLNIKDQLQQSQSKEIFTQTLQILDKLQEEIHLIFTSIKESIQAIQIHEKKIDDKFLQLIKENLNPVECSNFELDFLVNFLNGDIFEKEMEKRIQLSSFIKNDWSDQQSIQILSKKHCIEKDKNKLNFNKIQNLEKAEHLQINGQYGVKGNRIRKWKYFWKGQEIGYCQYNICGQQDGNQIELCDNYSDEKNVLEIGQCSKGKRCGKWSFYCGYRQIGGGSYNEEGIKAGRWVELDSQFKLERQIIYQGEYNMKGVKIGKWDIEYCNPGQEEYKKIGSGLYDQENQIKNGQWIELWGNFEKYTQVISYGKYSQEGIKVDKWDFQYRQYNEQKYRQIGDGSYNQEGIKISSWLQLDDGFNWQKQVIYKGDYNVRGIKIGQWDIYFFNPGEEVQNKMQVLQKFKISSGGGSYDQQGIKNGVWVELWERFCFQAQITYNGRYNKKGIKVDRWDICYRAKNYKNYEPMQNLSYYIYMSEVVDFMIKKELRLENGLNWMNTFFGRNKSFMKVNTIGKG